MASLPSAVLFCCDHNAVRSPMAEGIMKKLYGTKSYVQSAGVKSNLEIDGFAISVCQEIGVELSRHRSRSFDELEALGDDIGSFDLIVALSTASAHWAREFAQSDGVEVIHWPIMDPTAVGTTRPEKLEQYRRARDDIEQHMQKLWGGAGQ